MENERDLMSSEESMNYIGTFKGKFTKKVAEGTEGSITRVNKNGKTVHEKQFNVINGKLVKIYEKDSEFGKRWIFEIVAGEQKLALESAQKGNLASTIINRLPNLNLSQPFKLKIAYNVSKDRTMFFLDQDGEEVKDKYQHWDKDKKAWVREHGYPAWEKTIVDDEEVYDASKQIAFGRKVVKKYFEDVVEEIEVVEVAEDMPDSPNPEVAEDRDIPF